EIIGDVDGLYITYGLEEGALLTGSNVRCSAPGGSTTGLDALAALHTSFDVTCHDERIGAPGRLGTLTFHGVGLHNVRNALAACAVGLSLGMRFTQIADGLKLYDGVRRRLQVCGQARGVTVVEDYAHHPTEIACTLEAIRSVKPRRILGVFQPHLYSRTKYFADQFADVLNACDFALVTDIYGSRETPMEGVDSGLIVDAARARGGNVELLRSMEEAPARIARDAQEGDVVLVLGAGDINRICGPLLLALERDP
ncbi:MAG: UDP-N-acetylmuramate--L-alanine ligase, partial [Candidatus Hydrogenedentes bacterium]|nr:UDP-N-acetylmuramate--L-alanine ligase [Candidatus Hydrogenedentota bacterium]